MDLFERCYSFTRADEVKAMGLYPYFYARFNISIAIKLPKCNEEAVGSNPQYTCYYFYPKIVFVVNTHRPKYPCLGYECFFKWLD